MDVIEQYKDSRKNLCEYFGDADIWYNAIIHDEESWTDYGEKHSSVGWCVEEDDEGIKDVMYSMEVYGSSRWESNDKKYTLFIGDDGCGNRDCYIFKNSLRVDDV